MIIYDGKLEKDNAKETFGRVVEELAAADKDVVYLDADLMNSIGTHSFWLNNPDQAINVGVAEANMMGIAGGLSAAGKKPYVHTFAPFATRRSYDQSYISIGYAQNSAVILGSDAGVTAQFNGGTHMPFEDIALMRAMPESTVIESSSCVMLDSILKQAKDRKGVTYVRTTRASYAAMYSDDQEFEIGKGIVTRDGSDVTIVATGLMLGEAMKAAEELDGEISVRVVDMFTIKPIDDELLAKCAEETGAIVSAENHNVNGGLGDAVAQSLFKTNSLVPMKRVGVQDKWGAVGPLEFLQEKYGLTSDELVKQVREVVKLKK